MYHLKKMHSDYIQPVKRAGDNLAKILSNYRDSPFFNNATISGLIGGLDIFSRLNRKTKKPEFNIKNVNINGVEYLVKEEILVSKPFCNLLHFSVQGLKADRPKVLIMAPISGHFATLLRDTARRMLIEHDVYITDWLSASMVPYKYGGFGLDVYNSYIIEFLQKIGQNTHLMAVCQPVVQGLAVCAIMSEQKDVCTPKSLTLMGGPVDPRKNPTMVNRFAESFSIEWFKNNMIQVVPSGFSGVGRRVYPGFIQIMAFINMNPHKHFDAHMQYLIDCIEKNETGIKKHQDFYDEYLTTMDMDADFFIETIDKVFKEYELAKGTMLYKGELIKTQAITKTALLTVEGERDDISAIGQTAAAHELCPNIPENHKRSYIQAGVGHYGVFSGSKWRNIIAPVISEFIREQDKVAI